MSGIKKLAGQTIWYGVSSIAARFLNYLLTPYLTFKFTALQYGEMSTVYAFIPFMNIIFTYGLETAFFRYAATTDKTRVYNTTSVSLIVSTLLFSVSLYLFREPVAQLLRIEDHVEYITLSAGIIALDALSTIAFARLRLDERPRKFALIKVAGIVINIAFVYFFLSVCPSIKAKDPNGFIGSFFNPAWAVGYILLANLLQSAITLLLLSKEWLGFQWKFDKALWREMMRYSLPLIVVGFAGMINETLDRIMLTWWAPGGTEEAAKIETGIYSACYKLAILISLSIQAFRMGAEPFFFKQSTDASAPKTYARVMKFFVITICVMFLLVSLYLDIWKYFLSKEVYWTGLKVVPILLLANMFLGIYYNLSIWYKVTNKTGIGARITLIGAAITIVLNYLFIPKYGYMACAWATFCCYGTMMVLSFLWGQKEYYIPYAWKKLLAYIVIVVLLYFVHRLFMLIGAGSWVNHGFATILLAAFVWFILQVEKKEFQKLPVVGKWIK